MKKTAIPIPKSATAKAEKDEPVGREMKQTSIRDKKELRSWRSPEATAISSS